MLDPISSAAITTYLISFVMKLSLAVMAIIVGRKMLQLMDKWSGFDFKKWIKEAPNEDISIYLGCRILGMFIVMAFIFS